ncbi:hypothetical protein [Gelidibacter mesophilus]|uniref:hypothetical protein n=1 Tax=Gelidibacter mesophilus TaxID=169050 RepID=UPI0004194939|nr:hypothetical protein [Gelidibacter mesophilus]
MRIVLQSIIVLILVVSCKNKEDKEEGFGVKSINVLKSGINKAESLIVEKPYQYFKDRSKKADSIEKTIIHNHFENLKKNYPEYNLVANWFDSNPPELNGVRGNYYKIIRGVIKEGKTITRKNFINTSPTNTYKYFFESEDYYAILELDVSNEDVKVVNFRRILNGYGDEPMHDLIFNEKGELIKEIYQSDVDPSLYEENGDLFFEFKKDVNKEKIVNTINLGKYLDI